MIATCSCQHCNATIEFDPTDGQSFNSIQCPSCGKPTPAVLRKTEPPKAPKVGPIVALSLIAALVVVVAGVAGVGSAVLLMCWGIGTMIYFVPSLVAWGKRNFVAILALNFFLGWTLLGWVGALVWALVKEKQ